MDRSATVSSHGDSDLIWIKDVPDLISESLGQSVCLWTVREWCRKGLLDSVKVGGRRFVPRESIIQLLKRGNSQ